MVCICVASLLHSFACLALDLEDSRCVSYILGVCMHVQLPKELVTGQGRVPAEMLGNVSVH